MPDSTSMAAWYEVWQTPYQSQMSRRQMVPKAKASFGLVSVSAIR